MIVLQQYNLAERHYENLMVKNKHTWKAADCS